MHPTLVRVGHLTLPTFGALAACGLLLALALSARTARLARIDPDQLWDAGLFAVLAAFVLSRLQLIALHWSTFRTHPVLLLAVPSLTATALLLTALATAVWLRLKRIPLLRALDAWAPCALLVWILLALGHLAEGSDPGLPTSFPWSVTSGDLRVHPVALYTAFAAALLALAAYRMLRAAPAPGATAGLSLLGAGLAQFLLSFLRQPGAAGPFALDLLQWAAVGMIVAGVALVLRSLSSRKPVS